MQFYCRKRDLLLLWRRLWKPLGRYDLLELMEVLAARALLNWFLLRGRHELRCHRLIKDHSLRR